MYYFKTLQLNNTTSLLLALQEGAPDPAPPVQPVVAAQTGSEVPPVLGPHLPPHQGLVLRVKQEPEEVDDTPQPPGALSMSEPMPMGGTTGEGTSGGQPPAQKEVETSSEQPTLRGVSILVFYWEPSSLVTTGTMQYLL